MRTGMVLVISALLLSGCGGGSDAPPATSQPTDVRVADPDATIAAAEQAATNLPAFGSVTQSSNGGLAGVTRDAAWTTFDGSNVGVTIRRADGSSIRFDSATDRRASVDYDPVLPGYSYRGHGLIKQSDEAVSLAAVYVNSNDANGGDYLAGGYWLHVEGDLASVDVAGVEIGAFVDGDEIDEINVPANLPVSGSASYVGTAAGFYAYQAASSELGEFSGDLEMTANFEQGTVSGCVGCKTGVFVSGVSVDASGQTGIFEDVHVPAQLEMQATGIEPDGSFSRRRNVDLKRTDERVTSSEGSWGGKFSNIVDENGPRLAAGTAGASWTEEGGAQGAFVGAWFGVRQPN